MFWNVPQFSQPSPIEAILDKKDFTLETLLEQDDLLQECKSLNGRLIQFLSQKEQVQKLVRYIVVPGDINDENTIYRFPYTCCEVFCCDSEQILCMLAGSDDILDELFAFIKVENELNTLLAGYFGRVVCTLLARNPAQLVAYFRKQKDILEHLVNHMSESAILEVILKLITCEDEAGSESPVVWLSEANFLQLIFKLLQDTSSKEQQQSAAEVLTAVAKNTQSPILSLQLVKSDLLDKLLTLTLQPGSAVFVSGLNICIALLEARQLKLMSTVGDPCQTQQNGNDDFETIEKLTVEQLAKHMSPLVKCLDIVPDKPQLTPFGKLDPPFGFNRLKVIETIRAFVCTGSQVAYDTISENDAITPCLTLFKANPLTNLLHQQVLIMLLHILSQSTPPEAITRYLLDKCQLLTWILSLPESTTVHSASDERGATATGPTIKAAYRGHVTRIANAIETVAESEAYISNHAEGVSGWKEMINTVVAKRNEQDDVMAWNCGRPEVADTSRLGESNGDYSAGRYATYDDADDDELQDAATELFNKKMFNAFASEQQQVQMQQGEYKSPSEVILTGVVQVDDSGEAALDSDTRDFNVLSNSIDDDQGFEENAWATFDSPESPSDELTVNVEYTNQTVFAKGGSGGEAVAEGGEASESGNEFSSFNYWKLDMKTDVDVDGAG